MTQSGIVDETLAAPPSSLLDLYVDTLWNLYATTNVMIVVLPRMADAVSHPELATVLRDALGQASHAAERLKAMLSHFPGPARVHATEIDTLIGVAARQLVSWPRGDPRDVALSTVVRCAIHTAIPGCELAVVLAETNDLPEHAGELKALRDQMQATDERLRRAAEQRIRRLG